MWSEVLGLALLSSFNPILIGFILLVISRPRPVQNLLAFWIGALIVNVPALLIPLLALHLVPSFATFAKEVAVAPPGSSVQPLQFTTGVIALVVATLIALRIRMTQRAKQPVATAAGGDASVSVLDPETPDTDARPPGRIRAAMGSVVSFIRRLLGRGKEAWENGALWVALVLGMGYIPPPPLVLLVDTIVAASDAPFGVQVVAVVVFIFAMLAVFEFALLCYVISPTRTQAVLEPVHEWAQSHSREVLVALFAVVGLWQVVTGSGLL